MPPVSKVKAQVAMVLDGLPVEEATIRGLVVNTGLSKAMVHRAVKELLGMGFIASRGTVRESFTGPESTVWELTHAGALELLRFRRGEVSKLVRRTMADLRREAANG